MSDDFRCINRLSRRAVLGAFVSGVAVCAVPSRFLAGGAESERKFKLGFSLYGMRSLAIDEAVKHCARIGYQAVELALMPGWPADPAKLQRDERARIRKLLSDLNLELPALMENLPLDGDESTHRSQLDRLKAACDLAHELNAERPPLIETILGGKVGQWMQLRERFAMRLGDWATIAEQTKTLLCIKAHRMGAMNRPEEARWLVDRLNSPWLKLVYDYSHFQHRDMSIAETVNQLIPHVRFVHVKDTLIENDKARFVLPGDGGVDYRELFSQLRKQNYDGCACVEVSGMVQNQPNYNPIAAAERSYRNLLRFL